jgi:sugar lactone lactonase YvrE
VYVADTLNSVIRKITPNKIVTTLAGTAETVGGSDGTGTAARFGYPNGVATDMSGNVYVADSSNNAIRKITPAGVVTTLAGLAAQSGSDNGIGGAARFNNPQGLAVDPAGSIYVADRDNRTIRKIAAAAVVTTVAGVAGMTGYSDTAPVLFDFPNGLATDAAGNVYVGDTLNSAVREITQTGTVSTPGKGLPMISPKGIAADAAGTLYVADTRANSILKIANGFVTTFAGTGNAGSGNGPRLTATFGNPQGIAMDRAGTFYVADTGNNMIRKIATDGTVSTLAGAAVVGDFKDAKIGTDARFNTPLGVVTDSAGNLYVADTGNGVIRKINTTTTEVTTVVGVPGLRGVKLGVLPGGLNSPSYLALMPGSATTLLVTDENAVLQIELP